MGARIDSTKSWIDQKLTLTNALLGAIWAILLVDIYNQEGPIMSSHLEDIVVLIFCGVLLYFSRKLDLVLKEKNNNVEEETQIERPDSKESRRLTVTDSISKGRPRYIPKSG